MEAIALGGEARQAQWAAVRARALAALEKAGGGGHDVSDEPRDPSGKWTSGGGDGGKTSDEDMRLVGSGVDKSRVENWRKELEAQLDALEKEGKVGTDEWDKINRTEIALGFFINASEKDKAAGHASLVEVHDGNNKLLAAVFTQHNPKTLVSIIEAIGGLEKAALTKALEHTVLHEESGNKAERIEKVEFKDQTDTIEAMKAAGFTGKPMQTEGVVRMVRGVAETSAEKPPDLEHLPVPVELSEGTGGSFQADFARAVRDIPPRAAKTMADAGIKVRAGARITQLKPELKGVHPRGWPRGMTWDTAEGLYDQAQKAVHITEFYRPVGSKKFVPSGRIRGVLLHESGHAFDHALGYPSNFSTAYIDAYADDVKQMAKDEKFSVGYYLQKGKAGRSEAFAELFAQHVNEGAGSAKQDIREFFPNVSRLVKQAMDRGSWLEERRALEMSREDAEPSRMNWYFQLVGSIVHLDARLEDGDMLGDAHTEISRGENFYGVNYDALREAKNGVVEVNGDKGKIGLPGGTKPVEKAAGAGHDVSDEPRDPSGKWTDGGGSDDGKGEHPGEGYSKHAYVDKHGVIHTSNVYDAQRALFENRKVELKQPKQISTLIKRLGETAAEMAEQGEAAPTFNLCLVSVEGTNLFCAESKGIPRVEMPVIPAKQTKKFIKYLKDEGYKVEKDNEYAANLRATQSEIDGVKVATQMARIKKDGFYKRLVISKDDYILDGHHTWAGALGIDAQDNNLKDEKLVRIARVNISITKLLEEAEKWTKEHGIAKKPVGAKQIGGTLPVPPLMPASPRPATPCPAKPCQALTGRALPPEVLPRSPASSQWADVRARALAALREFDESKHPRVPAGSPEGGEFGTGGGGEGASADEPKLDPVVINVGGDEWNRATARKLEREYQSVRPKLETMAAESVGQSAAQAAPATGDDEDADGDPPYEPEEWGALSNAGQSIVEEKYIEWSKSDYESSESDYWYEEYAPHEARELIAQKFNDETDREWAEEALAESALPERGPFTNEQILQAVTIKFDGNPGGSVKDPEFEWDDKYLDELKGPDPAQINLPGIEAIEGHELLTDDMRAKIEKVLEKAFDKKGDDEAGKLDVPDWVMENAAESAGESFGQMDDDDKFAWAKAHTNVIEDETTAGTGDYAEVPAEVANMEIDALPKSYDPLNESSGSDYQRTQKLARYLSVERTMQVLKDRKLATGFGSDEIGQNQLRARIAKIDSKLWGAWKDSSVADDGKLLQLATSDELGGRMNLKTATDLDPGGIKARANKYYEDIGGFAGIKAYVRAKWETTQFLLDKGHIQTLDLYRGIDMEQEKYNKTFKHYPAHQQIQGYRYMPTLPVERNGAASTTTDISVANNWKATRTTQITLRAQVPRTAAVSVPAYGINIHSEHEVVVAGTAWRGWDAWAGKAPPLHIVPLQHAA